MSTTDVVLPDEYGQLLEQLKQEVRATQLRAARAANTELLGLYWSIGRAILDRQQREGWGAKVIERLARDLRAEFPTMKGLSQRNLQYMASAAGSWPGAIAQHPAAQLPWGHVIVLLDKLDDPGIRDWYAVAARQHGWSRDVLLNQIKNRTHDRAGAAPTNFSTTLPPTDSELAQQMVKDPYVFDFLELTGRVAERDLEQALMDRLQDTLMELGRGFAFVGRQHPLHVAGDEFVIDLLFFHVEQLRYVVVELKIGSFIPEFAGKLAFYVTAVDEQLKLADHNPTVGLLLCAARNDTVVRYALRDSHSPMAVATYTYESLPAPERAALPSAAEVTGVVADTVDARGMTIDQYLENLELAAGAAGADHPPRVDGQADAQ